MKVALLSDCYLPRLGGIEVQVHDLADELRRAGHEVEVFTATPGVRSRPAPAGDVEDGILVHRYPVPLPGGRALSVPVNPFATAPVRAALAGGGFDVAHVHMGVVSPFAADMAGLALRLGIPTAVTWHCVVNRSAPVWRAIGYAARWARQGAALSAVSRPAAARVSQISRGARVEVLGNGIDVDRWRPAGGPPPAEELPSILRISSAQRMVRRKRPFVLLDVLERTRALVPAPVRLEAVVAGEGPWRAAMQRWIARRDMAWVSLPGRLAREELAELHRRSDVYVSAARLEAFGIAALEARTAGAAAVVLRGTGSSDFVADGVSGLVAPDDAGLAHSLARLATEPGLLARIRTHNATIPPDESWPAVVAATMREYERAGA